MVMIPAFQAGGPGSIPGWRILFAIAMRFTAPGRILSLHSHGISGLVVEYIVAIDVTRVRFPADALFSRTWGCARFLTGAMDWVRI